MFFSHSTTRILQSCRRKDTVVKERGFDPNDIDTLTRLRKLPVFNGMNETQLAEVLKLARLRQYEEGETVMRQGEMDQMVHVLIRGECQVSVNDVDVATISRLGEIFGEMGMVDPMPRSATVRALRPTLCLGVDGSFAGRLSGLDQINARGLLYKAFSEILAERLRRTNARITELEKRLEDLAMMPPE